MKKQNSNYWKGRFDQVEQAANNKSVKYTKDLEKKYRQATKEIDAKINAWYQRLAINNNISVAEARKLLTNSELAEFKWDVQQYIEAGRENAIDQRWMKELENASAKFHINRLEALKLECRQQIELAFANGQEAMFDTLAEVYKDTFYHSCFEVQKGIGVGFDVSKLNNSKVQTLLNKPWSVDGENFSSKVWKNKTKLLNTLDQELSRMVMTGESPKKAIENIKKAMNTSLYNAKRLVMTEQAYFTTLGQKDCFNELDVEEYEIVATLDSRTSETCQGMDGKHFPVKDMQPGVNAPPFHVFCRSTTCPYFNDEFTLDDKRVAKGDDGKWYEVPANMTYPEWKKSFVDGGDKSNLKLMSKVDDTDSLATSDTGVVYPIKQSAIDKVSLTNIPNLDDDKLVILQELHRRVLKTARDKNQSMEVALLLDENMNDIGDIVLGTAKDVDLNVSGRSKALYVIHNHPNNESFSNVDLSWFMNNDNVKYFSIVKNNGEVELLYKSNEFDLEKFRIEYKRMVKKYQKDIDIDEQMGYNKVVKQVLTKTKSGLIHVR